MDNLESFYNFLDNSEFDVKNEHEINSLFQKKIEELINAGEDELASKAEIARQSIIIRKSFHLSHDDNNQLKVEGLKGMLRGTKKLEDDSELEYEWPDYRSFTDEGFDYIRERYENTKNLYLKTEYGLLLFFAKKPEISKRSEFKSELANLLFKLSEDYLAKFHKPIKENFYRLDFIRSINASLYISQKYNSVLYDKLNSYLLDLHKQIDYKKEDQVRLAIDISNLFLRYYNSKNKNHLEHVLLKNEEIAENSKDIDKNALLLLSDVSIGIKNKNKTKREFSWERFKAEQYEILSNSEKSNLYASIKYIEESLKLYRNLKDVSKINELEKRYEKARSSLSLSVIDEEMPKEYNDYMNEVIKRTAEDGSSAEILDLIMFSPMFRSIKLIRETEAEFRESASLWSAIPVVTVDKFGNSTGHYDAYDKFSTVFWQAYSLDFQLGYQSLIRLFWASYRAGKLNFDSVSSFLSNTWMNQPITRVYEGKNYTILPADPALYSIKLMFDEMARWEEDRNYPVNIVSILDSIALKVESILRYFFIKADIPTSNQKVNKDIFIEKNLDQMLDKLEEYQHTDGTSDPTKFFLEEDRIFIKYVMTEHIGLNMRNNIAHGLLDIFDYDFNKVILVFSILIRLCKYQIVTSNGND